MKGDYKKYLIIGLGVLGVLVAVVLFVNSFVNRDSVEIQPEFDLIPAAQKEQKINLQNATTLYDVWAAELVAEMPLEEKVGQMFIIRSPETMVGERIIQYRPGGILLFARDFRNRQPLEVKAEIQGYQDYSKIDLLIGVDEEGGGIIRVSRNPQYGVAPFPSPQKLFQAGGFDAVAEDTRKKSDLLLSLGINLNFAPVCDVSTNPSDYIYKRTLGQNAEMTSQYVWTVAMEMGKKRIGSVLKHFPGYGNNQDSHVGGVRDERSMDTFLESDFLPFQAGIAAGADCILVSHNTVVCMDEQYPASLSPEVHRILREDLSFKGVIVTDDLEMNAITNFADEEEAAVLAVEAGNDLLCCSHFEVQIPAVIQAVLSGRIPEERIDESAIRILSMKMKLGILPQKADFLLPTSFTERELQDKMLQD